MNYKINSLNARQKCSACLKQNVTIKTASDMKLSLVSAIKKLCDLFSEELSFFINKFKQIS